MDNRAHIGMEKNLSTAIKGLAILLMVAHHCFGFPEWYIQGIDYSHIQILGAPLSGWVTNSTHICVSLFAFLTGWAYFFNKKPSLTYGLKKIVNFLKYYWFILLLIFLPAAVILGRYVPSAKDILLNMFAVRVNLVSFAWYVYFYIFVMLTLPFAVKLFKESALFNFFFAIAYCALLYNLISHVVIFRADLTSGLLNCLYWYPCVLIGYLFAKHDLFSRLHTHFRHPYKILYLTTILLVMGCRIKWQTVLGVNLDVIYAPVAVFSLVMLLNQGVVRKVLEFLGRHAMNIWFLHSIFFSPVLRSSFQKIAYLPRNPILVVIWVLLLCLPFSMAINFIFGKQEQLFGWIRNKIHSKKTASGIPS
jgi:hypothetical protein